MKDEIKFLQIEIDILVGLLRPLEEELGWDITFLIEKIKSLPVEPSSNSKVTFVEMED